MSSLSDNLTDGPFPLNFPEELFAGFQAQSDALFPPAGWLIVWQMSFAAARVRQRQTMVECQCDR
jgi:hypothetical protein